MQNQYVVAKGNPLDGITLYGPFEDSDSALEWAECNDREGDWWIVTVNSPEEDNEKEDQVGSHVFKGSSVVDDCSLCGQRYAHETHR